MAERPRNDRTYRATWRALHENPGRCWICGLPGATSPDHVPALALHDHREGSGCCELRPAHRRCNSSEGAKVGNALRRGRSTEVTALPSGAW